MEPEEYTFASTDSNGDPFEEEDDIPDYDDMDDPYED